MAHVFLSPKLATCVATSRALHCEIVMSVNQRRNGVVLFSNSPETWRMGGINSTALIEAIYNSRFH